MLIGSDDQVKVYLNGKAIHESRVRRSFVADDDLIADIELHTGQNVLVLKLINEQTDWRFSVRFTDSEGKPVDGIQTANKP